MIVDESNVVNEQGLGCHGTKPVKLRWIKLKTIITPQIMAVTKFPFECCVLEYKSIEDN